MKLLTYSTFRRIFRNRLSSVINLIGLTLSIITFLLIISWIKSETSYDRSWSGSDRIYRVALSKTVNGSNVSVSATNFQGAGTVLRNELPEVEAATGLAKDIVTVYTNENSFQNVNMFYADTSLFRVFQRQIQTETPENLFPDVHSVLISRSLARKLFGDAEPRNQKFKINEGWEFYVGGVFEDFPPNSHMKIDLLLSWKSLRYYLKYFNNTTGTLEDGDLSAIGESDPYSRGSWAWNGWYTYIKLKEGSSIQNVKAKVPDAIRTCISQYTIEGSAVDFIFQPVNSIHLHSDLDGEMFVNGSRFQVEAFSVVGVLILIISWFNFVNMSSTSFLKRTLGSGVKRALGARKAHIFGEHLYETLVLYLAAGLISLPVVFLLLRKGLYIVGFEIPPANLLFLASVCLILILIGSLISSIFPFWMIVRLSPSSLLKDKIHSGKSSIFSRKAAVIFQFAVSVFLIVGTISIFRQISFMQHQELGLNMEQVMVSFSPMTMNLRPDKQQKLETFKEEMKKIPGVIDFTTAAFVPGKELENHSNNVRMADSEKTGISYWLANIDQNYFKFFSINLLAGNNFFKESDYDAKDVIINKLASQKLGFTNPEEAINRFILINDVPHRVISVVENYHHNSLQEAIRPIVFFKSLKWNKEVGYYCAKVSPRNISATIRSVKAAWEKVYPKEPYIFSFLDDNFNAQYEADIQFGNIYMGFSVLAILIASMGLFAIARFLGENRTKEIGIRKVNGARISEILAMLNKDFVKWVAIAFVIATPIAYFAMSKWLENFAYKTELSWWIFALAGLLALGIALLTVSWQSWKAATRNPVEALRYE